MQHFVRLAGLVLVSGAAACASPVPDEFSKYEISSDHEEIGRIYHYVRTNFDGSDPEQVSVFRKSQTELEVYKARNKCTRSALVTAELDLERRIAHRITGGMLMPNAEHLEFAFMTYDPDAKQIDIRVEMGEESKAFSVPINSEPWHVYDFDFASLTVMTPYLTDFETEFSFDMIMFSTDPNLENPIIEMGLTQVVFERAENLNGQAVNKYRVGGEAFTINGEDKGGYLWLDAQDGHVVQAKLGIPNHREYQDFKLALTSIDDGGAEAWRALKLAHFEGCE